MVACFIKVLMEKYFQTHQFEIWNTARKVSKYGAFSSPLLPTFELNTGKYGVSLLFEYLSVFSPNTGKYVPEKIPYLDTFHMVELSQRFQSIGKENIKFPNNLYGDLLYPIASHCIRVYTSCKNISSSKPGEQSSGSAHLCENTTFPSIIIMKWKILYKILYMNMSNFKQ